MDTFALLIISKVFSNICDLFTRVLPSECLTWLGTISDCNTKQNKANQRMSISQDP